MDRHVYNKLILSDLHLGAETSRAREATRVLNENRFERLILLGDIYADLNFARLTKEHWKFLGISGSSQIPNAILKWSGWKGTTTEPHA
jgi:predicted phosphodiesterase